MYPPLEYPFSVAIAPGSGNIIISDTSSQYIQILAPNGTFIQSIANTSTTPQLL